MFMLVPGNLRAEIMPEKHIGDKDKGGHDAAHPPLLTISIDRDLNMCPSVPLPSRRHQDGHYVEASPMLMTSENRRL